MKVIKFLVALAFAGLSISSAVAQDTYIITANGTNFDVNGGAVITGASIQDAIDAIRTHANGQPCIIQFGETGATEPLNLGSSNTGSRIVFDNNGGRWGEPLTLTGKTVSSNSFYPGGVIETNIPVNFKAELTATGEGGKAIWNTNKLKITGGAVSAPATYGVAVYNNGNVEISGGTFSSTDVTINNDQGNTKISGGTITVTGKKAAAIQNIQGKVEITGGTVSANGEKAKAIYNFDNYNDMSTIEISGGTVSANGEGATTVSNYTAYGNIKISGGTVLATGEEAHAVIVNEGKAEITGGIVFAYGTKDTDVINGDYTQTGNAVIVAWNKAAGTTTYQAGTTTHIYKKPKSATTIWAKQADNSGIAVENGSNTGFITIEGITVTGTGIVETHGCASLYVYPNPTTGEWHVVGANNYSPIQNIEIYDVLGRVVEVEHSPLREGLGRLLPAGVYFLRIQTNNGIVMKKVVKQN